MKHNLKQALATAALLLCSMVAMAQTTATVDGITYEFITKAKLATVVASESGSYSGNIVIPEIVEYDGVAYSVTAIGENAFYKCFSLTSVTIPNSVTTIGDRAFYGCDRLTSITIPNSVTKIGEGAFCCSSLTSMTIPNSVTTIEYGTFQLCSGLTSVTIPNSVTTIGNDAFFGCSNLETIKIGNGIKDIYKDAFSYCENLDDVYCLATSVPRTESDAFENFYIEYATLHVPEESIDSYKNTAPWSGFGTIKAIDGDVPGTQTPVTPKCATPVITYSAGKLNIACDTEGAQFVTTITDSDIRTHYDSTIELTVTYNITTYATLAGYENSDTIQATLCWIDSTPTMEQIGTDISEIASTPVLVRSSNGNIFVSGAAEGTAIRIYSADGMNVGSAVSSEGETAIPTTLQKGKIAIVAIGNSRIKMVVR
ncbi:MAG: leucine-rich repeat domain-containing protein [Bacteroidaceae bacterium]|nr:leucine-rich repeat domain-containing protein [Bacteroidaceae bacterium]